MASESPIWPSASWAIDSEPIWARGIIVKYPRCIFEKGLWQPEPGVWFFICLNAPSWLACSRRSDSRAWERGREPHPPHPVLPVYNLTCSQLTAMLYYLSAWNRLYTCQLFLRYKCEIFVWQCWDFWRWHDKFPKIPEQFRSLPKKSEVFRRCPKSAKGEVIEVIPVSVLGRV